MACIFYDKPCFFYVAGKMRNFPAFLNGKKRKDYNIKAHYFHTLLHVVHDIFHQKQNKKVRRRLKTPAHLHKVLFCPEVHPGKNLTLLQPLQLPERSSQCPQRWYCLRWQHALLSQPRQD